MSGVLWSLAKSNMLGCTRGLGLLQFWGLTNSRRTTRAQGKSFGLHWVSCCLLWSETVPCHCCLLGQFRREVRAVCEYTDSRARWTPQCTSSVSAVSKAVLWNCLTLSADPGTDEFNPDTIIYFRHFREGGGFNSFIPLTPKPASVSYLNSLQAFEVSVPTRNIQRLSMAVPTRLVYTFGRMCFGTSA